MSLLDLMFEHTDDEFVKADIALVEAWYNTAYAKVQSIYHGCPSHEINHQRATVAMDEFERDHDLYAAGLASRDLDKSLTRSLVKLSRKHVAVLATPSGEEFREFMASTKNMRRLQDWRSQRRADSLGEAIDDLASYVSDTIISGPVNRYLWPTFKLFSKVAGVGGGTYLGAIVADLAGAGPGVDAGQTAATGIAAATGAIFGDRFQGAVVGLVDNMFSPRKRFTRSIVKYARSSSV